MSSRDVLDSYPDGDNCLFCLGTDWSVVGATGVLHKHVRAYLPGVSWRNHQISTGSLYFVASIPELSVVSASTGHNNCIPNFLGEK